MPFFLLGALTVSRRIEIGRLSDAWIAKFRCLGRGNNATLVDAYQSALAQDVPIRNRKESASRLKRSWGERTEEARRRTSEVPVVSKQVNEENLAIPVGDGVRPGRSEPSSS